MTQAQATTEKAKRIANGLAATMVLLDRRQIGGDAAEKLVAKFWREANADDALRAEVLRLRDAR
jgi:hypothetical protein